MGTVYLAYDPGGQCKVAVKVMNQSVPDDEFSPIPFPPGTPDEDPEQFFKLRFSLEARLSASLQHPGIVTIYDLRSDPGETPFMVMELLDGSDLQYRIHTKLPTLVEGLGIVSQVCPVLAYIHNQGVVHRNIKPANIFVTNDQAVKILDFGWARKIQPQAQTGLVLGTPAYMSPEQVRGVAVDGRSDIFSLGVVLHETLTGERPFAAATITSLLYNIFHNEPPELVLPDGRRIPELQSIVARALAKDVQDRFGTANEMGDAITVFLKSLESGSHDVRDPH